MAHSVSRLGDDTFRFSFVDLHDNYVSIPLTQAQVDEYRDVLDLFSTTPLKKEHKKLKKEKLWSSHSTFHIMRASYTASSQSRGLTQSSHWSISMRLTGDCKHSRTSIRRSNGCTATKTSRSRGQSLLTSSMTCQWMNCGRKSYVRIHPKVQQ